MKCNNISCNYPFSPQCIHSIAWYKVVVSHPHIHTHVHHIALEGTIVMIFMFVYMNIYTSLCVCERCCLRFVRMLACTAALKRVVATCCYAARRDPRSASTWVSLPARSTVLVLWAGLSVFSEIFTFWPIGAASFRRFFLRVRRMIAVCVWVSVCILVCVFGLSAPNSKHNLCAKSSVATRLSFDRCPQKKDPRARQQHTQRESATKQITSDRFAKPSNV